MEMAEGNAEGCKISDVSEFNKVWIKKCVEYEVEGARLRGRPKKAWMEIVQKDCQARKLNRKDAMDRSRWKKQIKDD